MPKLTIIRGLPGSGKSTFARELSDKLGITLLEPDALLVQEGIYNYSPERHAEAARMARYMVKDVIVTCQADCIYADVLPALQDVKRLIHCIDMYTNRFTYEVHDMPLLTAEESFERNLHKVRKSDIKRMSEQWEPWKES